MATNYSWWQQAIAMNAVLVELEINNIKCMYTSMLILEV